MALPTPELNYLVWVITFTAVMWIPYILNTIQQRGLLRAVGYPSDPEPLSPWAQRMKAAHYNAVENLVIFAPLVIVAHVLGVSSESTVLAAQVYFWARVVHYLCYTFAVPWGRTLSFAVGLLCQLTFAATLLGLL